MEKIQWLFFVMVLWGLIGCGDDNVRRVDVSKVPLQEVQIKRYEQALFGLDRTRLGSELERIAPQYKIFLGDHAGDTLSVMQMYGYLSDPNVQMLYDKVNEVYPDLNGVTGDMEQAFQRLRYFFSQWKQPEVYSFISGVDINNRVIYGDSVLLLGLDNYLGRDEEHYARIGVPRFKGYRMSGEFILPDCIHEIAGTLIAYRKDKVTLLDLMLIEGRLLYLMQAVLPDVAAQQILGYTDEEYAWCLDHEEQIWRFIIENKLLFSTRQSDISKFIVDGPFTSGFEDASPGRLGNWVGLQIVKRYMDKNRTVEMEALFRETDGQKVLKMSGYKPGR